MVRVGCAESCSWLVGVGLVLAQFGDHLLFIYRYTVKPIVPLIAGIVEVRARRSNDFHAIRLHPFQ